MKFMTISEGFKQAIGGRNVTRAFFSTYCLEPDFFELEVLPLLLDAPALSSAEPLRYQQLQALMGACAGRFGVAYDEPVFDPILAPRLEVDYLPVRVNGACHHAKLAIVEVTGNDGRPAIILCAGSFNLTKAGWWENIEVGHWVELTEEDAPKNILEPLRNALDFYLQQGTLPVLTDLISLLAQWRPTPKHKQCSFYFSGAGSRRFTDFLAPVAQGYLEIISPFFAEDSSNPRLLRFLKNFDNVSMLLPRDAGQTATVTEQFYAGLGENVVWSEWHESARKQFKLTGADHSEASGYRKLHAKIYAGESWLFVGSVNFSHQAMFANIEAGFLLTGLARSQLLGKAAKANRFAEDLVAEVHVSDAGGFAFPPVFLVFDWQSSEIEAVCSENGTLHLYDREGNDLLSLSLLEGSVRQSAPELCDQLKHSALILASWQQDAQVKARRNVVISQRHVYCRPSVLPPLDLHELLRILQSMEPARRATAFSNLAARLLQMGGLEADSSEFLPQLPDIADHSSFFAEFSQVNGAFWQLKRRLLDHPAEVAYYLDGEQPDSLRGILRSLAKGDLQADTEQVIRYLTLLSMDELLAQHERSASPLADDVRCAIAAEEASPAFSAIEEKDKFLTWIKRMFAYPVSTNVAPYAQD